jgi:hypothetical protein
MARTKRNIPYDHYWGNTKKEAKEYWEKIKLEDGWNTRWGRSYLESIERAYLLHGTDAKNLTPGTHEYFNRANRVARRIERDKLRPHKVLEEDFDFDDSRYRRKYKGIWWEIY